MNSITATVKAWHTSPEYAHEDDLKNPAALMYTNSDMRDMGWLCVGDADITVRITVSREDLNASMCDTLRKQIEDIRAKAQREVNQLQERINILQALTYEVKS